MPRQPSRKTLAETIAEMHTQIEEMAAAQKTLNDGYKHDIGQLKTKLGTLETRAAAAETRAGQAVAMANMLLLAGKFEMPEDGLNNEV